MAGALMKILHVARRFTAAAWGGTESVVSSLVREQLQRGDASELLATAALDHPGAETLLGVPVTRFPYTYARVPLGAEARAALDNKGGNPLAPAMLARLLREPGVDVYHCHTMQRLAGQVRFAAKIRRRPYVVQLHGGEFAVPTDEVREMMRPTARTFDWGKVPSALLGTRQFLSDADLVLVLSCEELKRARRELPGTRVEILPNGVDPAWLDAGDADRGRGTLGIPEGAPVALTVARVDPQKGQELVPTVLAANPDLHAVLIGPVTVPGYDDTVRIRATEAGVADRLHLLGGMKPESPELADAFAAADFFLLPSRHEPFGIVVLEAWSAGLPVVVSDAGGLGELVRPGVDGLIVPTGDGDAFAHAVATVLAMNRRGADLAEAGRRRVLQDYTWTAVARRLGRLYEELTSGRIRT
jgi:glycosyltransferase involved in cell wall biosynthesis